MEISFKILIVDSLKDATRPRNAGRGAKVVTARITASNDPRRSGSSAIAGQTLAPPMPSVVVERHQPITKVRSHWMFNCLEIMFDVDLVEFCFICTLTSGSEVLSIILD